MSAGSTRLVAVVFDSADPGGLARWWSDRLGWPVTYEDAEESVVEPSADSPVGRVPGLSFVAVADPKAGKNRVHLDLASQTDEDLRQQVQAALAAGARRVDVGQGDVPWEVLVDPEGNEFCILEPREMYADRGPLAAIVMDCADPAAIAPFWVQAAGWPVGYEDDEIVSLHNPEGTLPDLDLLQVPDIKQAKNRLHLDVAPWPEADLEAEVEALVSFGARRIDVGQAADVTWRVLADPTGNEFCVLRPR